MADPTRSSAPSVEEFSVRPVDGLVRLWVFVIWCVIQRHEPGCVLEHDPEETDCMTFDDLRDERDLARAEDLADDLDGWRNLR